MMMDLSDYEAIKKVSACARINRIDIVLSFQIAKQDSSGCDFQVRVYLWSFLCFLSLQYDFLSWGTMVVAVVGLVCPLQP